MSSSNNNLRDLVSAINRLTDALAPAAEAVVRLEKKLSGFLEPTSPVPEIRKGEGPPPGWHEAPEPPWDPHPWVQDRKCPRHGLLVGQERDGYCPACAESYPLDAVGPNPAQVLNSNLGPVPAGVLPEIPSPDDVPYEHQANYCVAWMWAATYTLNNLRTWHDYSGNKRRSWIGLSPSLVAGGDFVRQLSDPLLRWALPAFLMAFARHNGWGLRGYPGVADEVVLDPDREFDLGPNEGEDFDDMIDSTPTDPNDRE